MEYTAAVKGIFGYFPADTLALLVVNINGTGYLQKLQEAGQTMDLTFSHIFFCLFFLELHKCLGLLLFCYTA